MTKIKAKELYLHSKSTIKEIAATLEFPFTTLQSWIKAEKWPEEKRKLERDLQERSQYEASKIIRDNICKVMRRQLNVGDKIESHVLKILEKAEDKNTDLTPEEVMLLAKAFNSSGKVTSAVVGLNNRGKGSGDNPAPVAVLINTSYTPKDAPGVDPGPVVTINTSSEELSPEYDADCGF